MSLIFVFLAAPVAAVLLLSLARLFAESTRHHGKPRYAQDLYRTFHP